MNFQNANHKGAIKQTKSDGAETVPELEDAKPVEGGEDGSDDDSVTDWQFYVQNWPNKETF